MIFPAPYYFRQLSPSLRCLRQWIPYALNSSFQFLYFLKHFYCQMKYFFQQNHVVTYLVVLLMTINFYHLNHNAVPDLFVYELVMSFDALCLFYDLIHLLGVALFRAVAFFALQFRILADVLLLLLLLLSE